MADVKKCRPAAVTLLLFFWGGALTSFYLLAFAKSKAWEFPGSLLGIAAVFGAFSCLAILCFQAGLRYGKIATSWLFINLSMIVPTVLSIGIYREEVNVLKALASVLIFASVLCLWKDKAIEQAAAAEVDDVLPVGAPPEKRAG